jgi:hypothetical protein
MSNPDHWMLGRHQWAANWVFSRWSQISPYWIGAQMFLANMGLLVGYVIHRAQINGDYGFYTAMLLVNLFWQAGGWLWGVDQHQRWRDGKLLLPTPPGPRLWRIFFSIFGLTSLVLLIMVEVKADLFGLIWMILMDFIIASASYFLSCDAPSNLRRERENKDLLPQAT